jgi:hypothetical protein
MKRVLVLLVAVAILSGCAAIEGRKNNYSEMMESYIGAPESFLIDKWGPPDRVYETEDGKFLTYASSRIVPVPAPMPVGTRGVYPVMYGGSVSLSCNSTFKIRNGAVVSWQYRGNACR